VKAVETHRSKIIGKWETGNELVHECSAVSGETAVQRRR